LHLRLTQMHIRNTTKGVYRFRCGTTKVSNQEVSDSPHTSDKAAVAESIDRTTPAHYDQKHKSANQDGLDVNTSDAA